MKLYIAGPMTGIPQFNFPAFFALGEALRDLGYEVISPAEIDNEEDKGAALSSPDGSLNSVEKTWADFLMRDVKIIGDMVDGVCVLPNWHTSRGARLEVFVALNVKKPVFVLKDSKLVLQNSEDLAQRILVNTVLAEDSVQYEQINQGV